LKQNQLILIPHVYHTESLHADQIVDIPLNHIGSQAKADEYIVVVKTAHIRNAIMFSIASP
jgi:hypothetical protein